MAPAASLDTDFCLSQLLENVGNSDFSSLQLPSGHDFNLNNLGFSCNELPSQKKGLFDAQQQQDQNSLNNLLSQQPNANGFSFQGAGIAQDELESVAAQAAQFQQPQFQFAQQQPQQQFHQSQQQQQNNYNMFMATIVDPSQDDATPQQMLFLPGSNQVIPMPSNNGGMSHMMALANAPVVFNQNSASGDMASASFNGQGSTGQAHQNQTLQFLEGIRKDNQWPSSQSQGLLNLNGISSNLENMTSHNQALFDFPSVAMQAEQQQSEKVAAAPAPVFSPKETQANTNLSPVPAEDKATMPVRPLSAYNFFFSDERERILTGKAGEPLDNNKKERLLLQHLAKDRTKRRPHRKTHGKINFTTLSKLIGQRWKQLPDDRKNFYREVAAIDLERYQRELRERSPAAAPTN